MQSIIEEANLSAEKYGHFNSTHELYGVLKEEVDEFFDEVRQNVSNFSIEIQSQKRNRMITELKQVASVAYRGIIELESNQIKFI